MLDRADHYFSLHTRQDAAMLHVANGCINSGNRDVMSYINITAAIRLGAGFVCVLVFAV